MVNDFSFVALTHHSQTGRVVYASSTEVNISNTTADLVFEAKENARLTPNVEAFAKKHFHINPVADENEYGAAWVHCLPTTTDTTDVENQTKVENVKKLNRNITRVLVNCYIPPQALEKNNDRSYLTLVVEIGSLCREAFPNLKPEQSCFNVHAGFTHYRCDSQLLPGASAQSVRLLAK